MIDILLCEDAGVFTVSVSVVLQNELCYKWYNYWTMCCCVHLVLMKYNIYVEKSCVPAFVFVGVSSLLHLELHFSSKLSRLKYLSKNVHPL